MKSDNAIDDPAGRKGPKQLPLKPGAFNTVELAVCGDGVLSIELNGTPIYERKMGPDIDPRFGFYHDRKQTAVRVKNVVLTGNWPAKLASLDDANFSKSSDASPAETRLRRKLIGERGYAGDEAEIIKQTRSLPPAARYAKLADWVLPSEAKPYFNLRGTYTPQDGLNPSPTTPLPPGRRVLLGSAFESPVMELIEAAKQANQLDDLLRRIQEDKTAEPGRLSERSRRALGAAIHAEQGKDEEARADLVQLTTWVKDLPLDAGIDRRWPELIAALHTMHRPALRTETGALLGAMNEGVNQSMQKKANFAGNTMWQRVVRHARAEAQVLWLPEASRRPFGSDPGAVYWSPVAWVHDWTRGQGNRTAHWLVQNNLLRHYPGHQEDFIYFNVPLRGDFEVQCDLTGFGWREMRPIYGALRFDVMSTRKEYQIHVLGEDVRKFKIDPPLPALGDAYHFRLVVKDGAYTTYVNDRKMAEEYLGGHTDPWLCFQSFHLNTGGVRNLKVIGSPTIPDSIDLLGLGFDMRGWRGYEQRGRWTRRGAELNDSGAPPKPEEGQPAPPRGSAVERTLFYHRPMIEDGEFEYEFYYEKDKALVHPAFDRLAFMLEPDGVKLHWITDGPHEQSGLKVDNLMVEPANRRGGKLPLNDKSWNKVRLVVKGDTLTLSLNGQEIYQRAIESTNQRLFGFFHYIDVTEARIRQASYRGDWPKQLPMPAQMFSRR